MLICRWSCIIIPTSLIIVDHTTTDISRIPPYWISRAKELLRLSYGHTSHGSQLVSGMGVLETLNTLYSFNTGGAIQAGVLSLDDYTPSGDLGNPDRTSWADRTRAYLDSGTPPGNTLETWGLAGARHANDGGAAPLFRRNREYSLSVSRGWMVLRRCAGLSWRDQSGNRGACHGFLCGWAAA